MITSEVTQLLKEMDTGERNKKILTILSSYVHKSRILEANLQNCYKKFFLTFFGSIEIALSYNDVQTTHTLTCILSQCTHIHRR